MYIAIYLSHPPVLLDNTYCCSIISGYRSMFAYFLMLLMQPVQTWYQPVEQERWNMFASTERPSVGSRESASPASTKTWFRLNQHTWSLVRLHDMLWMSTHLAYQCIAMVRWICSRARISLELSSFCFHTSHLTENLRWRTAVQGTWWMLCNFDL